MADLGWTVKDTQTQIITSGTTITDGSFGSASTEIDNTSDEAHFIRFVLHINPSTAPDSNGKLYLHVKLNDIQSTNDGPVPDANYQKVLCHFEADAATGNQYLDSGFTSYVTCPFSKFVCYIENQCGQSTGTYNLYYETFTPAS